MCEHAARGDTVHVHKRRAAGNELIVAYGGGASGGSEAGDRGWQQWRGRCGEPGVHRVSAWRRWRMRRAAARTPSPRIFYAENALLTTVDVRLTLGCHCWGIAAQERPDFDPQLLVTSMWVSAQVDASSHTCLWIV